MRVLFDDQVFSFSWRGGAARYLTQLLHEYRSTPELGVEALTPFRYTVTAHLLERWPDEFRRPPGGVARRPRLLRSLNRVGSGRLTEGVDLVHHSYYFKDALRRPVPRRICSVYDMTPELHPDLFPQGSPHADKRLYVDACDAIVCYAWTTKEDLLKFYGHVDKPVFVTPLGVSPEFFDVAPPAVPGTFVLHVGHRAGYKNFDVLLRAMARLVPAHPDLSLMCAGPPFAGDEVRRFERLGLSGRVCWRDTPDRDLPGLLSSAACLVFPSVWEGFGLPTIEAFASGCPVIVAEARWSTEVGGEAPLYFPPRDDDALAVHLERMLGDRSERSRRISAGRRRARDFTWHRTAVLTRDAYREVIATVPGSGSSRRPSGARR